MSAMNNMTDKVATFFSKKVEYNSLSNFWEGDIEVYGREYESGEHAFHGEKYFIIGSLCEDENRQKELLNYAESFLKPSVWQVKVVKQMGGKNGLALTEDELEIWSEVCEKVQVEICKSKYEKYEVVRNDLKNTGNKILIHPAMRCSEDKVKYRIWEGKAVLGEDGEIQVLGGNKLGFIWMYIRDSC